MQSNDSFPETDDVRHAETDSDGAAPGRGKEPGRASDAFVGFEPGPVPAERLHAVRSAPNPLLEAAQPLLRMLTDMPETLEPEGVDLLRKLLEREVASFQALCSDARIRHEHAVAASYALCTALDEAASSTAWGGAVTSHAGVWAADPLADQFHGDTKGGDKFFLLIGRLAASPQDHADLLELMYQLLGLGFEGRFSTPGNGPRQLETIRQRLYSQLTATRGEVPQALSPHWRGEAAGQLSLLRRIPVWLTAMAACAAAMGLFAWYRYQLEHRIQAVEQRISSVRVAEGEAAAQPGVPAVAPLRLRQLLASEITAGLVSVQEERNHSAVSFAGDGMFMPGRAVLTAQIQPVLIKVADEIRRVPGTVQIIGHTDSVPIRTSEFASNQVLSERRAQAVAALFKQRGVESARIRVEGRGDSQPVADNATPSGRAKNRRVDIVVDEVRVPTATAPATDAAQTPVSAASVTTKTPASGSTVRTTGPVPGSAARLAPAAVPR